jgi:hypothetical protein
MSVTVVRESSGFNHYETPDDKLVTFTSNASNWGPGEHVKVQRKYYEDLRGIFNSLLPARDCERIWNAYNNDEYIYVTTSMSTIKAIRDELDFIRNRRDMLNSRNVPWTKMPRDGGVYTASEISEFKIPTRTGTFEHDGKTYKVNYLEYDKYRLTQI